jgi:hypothetical protein
VLGFLGTFDAPGTPSIPSLASAQAVVEAGSSVDIPLAGVDPAGGSITYVVDTDPELGTVTPTATGLHYAARGGSQGLETLRVRAVNGVLGSDQATVSIDVRPPAGQHAVAPPHHAELRVRIREAVLRGRVVAPAGCGVARVVVLRKGAVTLRTTTTSRRGRFVLRLTPRLRRTIWTAKVRVVVLERADGTATCLGVRSAALRLD